MTEDSAPLPVEVLAWGPDRRPALRLVPTGAVLFATLTLDGPAFDLVPMPAGGGAGPGGSSCPGRPIRAALVRGAEWLLGR